MTLSAEEIWKRGEYSGAKLLKDIMKSCIREKGLSFFLTVHIDTTTKARCLICTQYKNTNWVKKGKVKSTFAFPMTRSFTPCVPYS